MKAVILAAGMGSRLYKYTEELPKGMLEFNGETLIGRQIRLLRELGIDDILIIRGYEKEKINYENILYIDNLDYSDTNMVYSLKLAENQLLNNEFILLYSDIVYEKEMLKKMIDTKEDFSLAVDNDWKEYWIGRYGTFEFDIESLSIDSESNLIELGNEDVDLDEIDSRYIGILKFSRMGSNILFKTLNTMLIDNKKIYMTDLIQKTILDNNRVKAVQFNNGWLEFDTNEDYERACSWLKNGDIKKYINL